MKLVAAIASVLALAACQGGVACQATPPPDAGPPAPAPAPAPPSPQTTAACANLAKLGCPEGADPACPAALARGAALGHGFYTVQMPCLAAAETPAAARACSPQFVTCPPK